MLALTLHLFNPPWQISRKYLKIYHTFNLMNPIPLLYPRQVVSMCVCGRGRWEAMYIGCEGMGEELVEKKKQATFFSDMTTGKEQFVKLTQFL